MCDDWIYSVFDAWWRPSDEIEDDLGLIHGAASRLFRRLRRVPDVPGPADRARLCDFLALTACRHVDAMARSHALSKEVALEIADAAAHASEADYLRAFQSRFHAPLPRGLWQRLFDMGQAEAFAEAEEVLGLQPYDSTLPTHLASLCATLGVGQTVKGLDVALLDAPPGHGYVLGDCPVPLLDIGHWFDVPCSA